ncbi:MAG: peptidylprolyl isomerase [Anaerolineales bacterium]|jgi:cyclophilin family peptidyl-prolyl cis-trans isomerase/protein-disulfide isomerase|nr:peptidylprolyl isomerase [Anaerolineales bacterium]
MKKTIISFLFLGIALIAAACADSEEATPVSGVTPFFATEPAFTPTPEFACTLINVLPTAQPAQQSLVPPVADADFSIGAADAPVTIIEYCDFQSDICLAMAQTIAELMRNYPGSIRLVFRPFPLTDYLDKSDDALLAAFAADEQGKFWEMYDLLFVKHAEWVRLSQGEFRAWLGREASAVGVDPNQLSEAMKADAAAGRLKSAKEAVSLLPVQAVPLVFINDSLQQYYLDYQSLNNTVGLILLGGKQFTECPPFTIQASKQYIATIETEKGDIVIQLFADKAPLAVNSFVFLARQGWYNGVTFHRVIPGFAAQAGDPSGTGMGNPGYLFKNETSDLLFSRPGMVAMANSGPDTNGSQFFITFAPASHLNGNFTIFGQVISGLDAAEQLTPREPTQGVYLPPGDVILNLTIEEK